MPAYDKGLCLLATCPPIVNNGPNFLPGGPFSFEPPLSFNQLTASRLAQLAEKNCPRVGGRPQCAPSDSGPGVGELMWDRGSTAGQYGLMWLWRNVKNPDQFLRGAFNGTVAVEYYSAQYQIWANDAELFNEGAYCGTRVECLTGARTPMGSFATLTLGHTLHFGVNQNAAMRVDPGHIAHEMDHVYMFEFFGAINFGALYGMSYGWNRGLGMDGNDAYYNNIFEKHAREAEKGVH